MQLFFKLFGSCLQWVYHCFDRIVINGHLSGLQRENQIVYFFQTVCGQAKITKELLLERTRVYQQWVKSYAANHKLTLEWAEKGVRKEDLVRPTMERRLKAGQYGVYYILQSMEQGWTFRVFAPKYTSKHPDYQIVKKQRARYTHYYFYIVDEVVGPMSIRVGSFLPFAVTAYLNGHHYIARELDRQTIKYVKDDNRFVSVENPEKLQTIANGLNAEIIQQRVDYWALIVSPKFSPREREAAGGLHRFYYVEQIEYCRNFIFKRSWPIRSIFQRSCELGLFLLTADRVTAIFGGQKRRRIQGKLQNVFERMDHGMHVFRTHWRNSFLKQYEKASTFLRMELVCNNVKNFKLKKSLNQLESVREKFQEVTDRFAHTQAEHLNVHGQLDILARLSKPVIEGQTKVSGIKLEQTRMMRLIETLLQGAGGHLRQWTTASLRKTILSNYHLNDKDYTLNQIRYDLRKLRLHGIIERIPQSYAYRFTKPGMKQAILLTQLRKRVYGPIAYGTLRHKPDPNHAPDSKFERAYLKVDKAMDEVIELMAA
jgi:hypothetical protein